VAQEQKGAGGAGPVAQLEEQKEPQEQREVSRWISLADWQLVTGINFPNNAGPPPTSSSFYTLHWLAYPVLVAPAPLQLLLSVPTMHIINCNLLLRVCHRHIGRKFIADTE